MRNQKLHLTGKAAQTETRIRVSISFPNALRETLEHVAQRRKVSLAWVVRGASERYAEEGGAEQPRLQSDKRPVLHRSRAAGSEFVAETEQTR